MAATTDLLHQAVQLWLGRQGQPFKAVIVAFRFHLRISPMPLYLFTLIGHLD